MPVTRLPICANDSNAKAEMSKCNKYDECDDCSNLEYDPFACEECVDLSNFEPYDRQDDESLVCDEMPYSEFITWVKRVA